MDSQSDYQVDNRNPQERKLFVRNLFDSIVPGYDALNHLLSFGTDVLWRKDLVRRLGPVEGDVVLDLCCGTGDVSRLLHRRGAGTVSLDFSREMIEAGVRKGALSGHAVAGDATLLPFVDSAFDAVTIAFGVRNIPDLDRFVAETCRVLKPGGRLAILELVRPENSVVRLGYSFYLARVLPFVGGTLSGKRFAYRYLSDTIATFIHPNALAEMLAGQGFADIEHHPRTFGVATIIVCRKDAARSDE